MSSWLVVIPSINPLWGKRCIQSLTDKETNFEHIIVKNYEKDHGVAGAWNIGVDRVIDEGIDWLVICSESMRFKPNSAKKIQQALDNASSDDMVLPAEGFGWHLIAIRRELFLTVGYFDEVFFPAYFEDNDYHYRVKMISEQLGKPWYPWAYFTLDAKLLGTAQGLRFRRYEMDFGFLKSKYEEKWGGSPVEVYKHPYNNPEYSLRYAERYHRL